MKDDERTTFKAFLKGNVFFGSPLKMVYVHLWYGIDILNSHHPFSISFRG